MNASGSRPGQVVIGYRGPKEDAPAEQPPAYGFGLLQAAGGFLSAVALGAVGVYLGGLAARFATGGAWLLGFGPVLLTIPSAVRVVRTSSRPSRRAFRDGFLAGTIIVSLLGLIMIGATVGGSLDR